MIQHGPLVTKPRRNVILWWGLLAAANLAAGMVTSLQPERLTDLESVRAWGHAWLVDAANVYAVPDLLVDYPPHAVVFLSPLALVPASVAPMLWAVLNVAFVILAAYLAARFYAPHAPYRTIALPLLMGLTWWGGHVLTQFSLFVMCFAMGALVLAEERPLTAGALLGVALVKPQVALPALLWVLFGRRWRVCAAAVAVVIAGTAMYGLRAHVSILDAASQFLHNLRVYYSGDAVMKGSSELRPLIAAFIHEPALIDRVCLLIAGGLLTGICVMGVQEAAADRRIFYAAPPLVACWCLLSIYHLSYGYVVLLPALMMLALHDGPHSVLRTRVFWFLQLGMLFDPVGITQRIGLSLPHIDRVFIAAVFAGLIALAWRETAHPTTAG